MFSKGCHVASMSSYIFLLNLVGIKPHMSGLKKFLCLTLFPNLFRICRDKSQSVVQVVENNILHTDFRRIFGTRELEVWGKLVEIVEVLSLNSEEDRVVWSLKKREVYHQTLV
jgi:hypothetical protein